MSDSGAPPLAAVFPAASESDWRKRVDAVLKGADFEQRLFSRTMDGIAIAPLYTSGEATQVRRPEQTPWTVMQRADHPDAGKANAQALDDLNHGATGLNLVFADAPGARGFGLATLEPKNIARLLNGIRIDAIDLRVEAGPHGKAAATALAQWIDTQPVDPERLRLCFGLDPIGSGAALGRIDPDFANGLRQSVTALREQHFAGPFAEASGVVWHDAGASGAQELAFMLASGVAYLRALDTLTDDHLKRAVALTLAAGQDMFVTLAKFRAARLLWTRILAACGLATDAITVAAETSWRMMAARDPHTNILRTTAAVFAAALGGADRITVLPFSLAQGFPDAFARRIARNTQTILQEESQLWRVSDPASGGYVEHLTATLCDKAWTLFKEIERQGGIVAAIESGHIASLIAEKRIERLAGIENKAETIIGVTAYRPATEMTPAIEDVPRRAVAQGPLAAMRFVERFESTGAAA
ncbi:MAG TPA: methylmalonyl-CoA mutase subunit beta [Nordella sp.]|nr:methylmalonyl-CoA mutase subunit beta [Nordella sp.]